MRFELLQGEEWRGDYMTRRAAIADAELIAAKRGQAVEWARDDSRNTIGVAKLGGVESARFTVRVRGS